MKLFLTISAVLLATAVAQQVGTQQNEDHPKMAMQTCDAKGNCVAEKTKIVVDANWRWTHLVGDYRNCYKGNLWNTTMCPDDKTCAANCAVEGADYWNTYGVQSYDSQVTLKFVTKGANTNVGSRIYLMEDDTNYKMFKLLNHEFTFDVDASKLECGLNGALYFSQMDQDGGLSRFPGNKAGAKYGTGYCDAQCARDIKFINGEANSDGWKPSATDVNGGTGKYGSCCSEMDIWEANKVANAYTSHPCSVLQQTRCESDKECGTGSGNRYTGLCDMDGCDLNPFRMGDQTFYGPGSKFKVDSTKKVTVVTQFITDDGTDNGNLIQIKRLYKQGSKVIENTNIAVPGVDKVNYLSDAVCSQAKTAFGDQDDHKAKGGLKQMGAAMKKGMVLVMSLWDDHTAHCLWLDSKYPTDKDASIPGVLRGSCPTSSGDPKDLEATIPDASVTFSNIKFGPIGSTYVTPSNGGGSNAGVVVKKYGQCGGNGYTGPTTCEAGTTCVDMGEWYSMCQ